MSKHATFAGQLVIIGFGSIGQGSLPLILRHFDMDPSRITIITADERGRDVAEKYGIRFIINPLTPDNYRQNLTHLLGDGDFLLNVSVDVSSLALIELCWERGALYLDTCIEPWAGGYTDPSLSPSLRSNYALREQALKLRAKGGPRKPTAVLTHGANPGLVSHFIKQGLLDIARDSGLDVDEPETREEWAELAERLGVKTIHVAERDTQVANVPKKVGEFVNTWSIDGFVGEGCQPAELGWGTHERHWPDDAQRHDFGCDAAIYLMRPGASTRVRTWTPREGNFHGFLITHSESISTADFYTVRDGDDVRYRPTVHYAYHPCDDAVTSLHELAGKNWEIQPEIRLMGREIVDGIDELGVLLAGHDKGAYWFGSQLSIDEARDLAPHNTATSLQVTASVLGGMVWALENPQRGMVEPEDVDFQRILEIATPYLGPVVGAYTDWTPLAGRGQLFPEDLDHDDPWQFKNVRVC
ncbi:homospermidine synthase [Magnetospirillum aberrantis]|uniref:Homospermidine synthase n=1 Tax=Magnetospirillum aberrantis SpK TaxID=908842 RepID=A0A7C9UZK8_9PROT|nr:saccharopine dehydrogenase C-terminal domain-containing protein [Magnetospirillum aberrantis]NFV80611.1 homospermidine synthase [Magnetospirillum aberrantis SpK]